MATVTESETYTLSIDSAAGPVYRTVKKCPPRDARPDEITIIDASGIYSDDISKRQAVADQVREACTRIGFFYLINHGIPDSVTDAAAEACLDFFHQSIEDKSKIYFDHEIEGWTGMNNEQINASESVDVREKFKLHYRPSMDPTSKLDGYPTGGVYQEFPWERTAQLPSFERAMTDAFTARLQLARKLLGICALALDLPEDYFKEKVAQPNAALVLNYYPSMKDHTPKAEDADKEQVGLGSHTDFGVITILWQDETGGLQVLSPEGEWIIARPIPGSLICNMGDFMSMITNGKFISDVHKAKNESEKERISIPFFLGFGPKVKIELVDSCLQESGAVSKKYEGWLAGEWVRQRQIDLKVAKLGKGGVPLK